MKRNTERQKSVVYLALFAMLKYKGFEKNRKKLKKDLQTISRFYLLICNDLLSRENDTKPPQTYLIVLKASGKSLGVSVPGIGHSDIRGLVTYRSMVRRELYRLRAWITDCSVPT